MDGVKQVARRVLLEELPFPGYARAQGKPPWEIVPEWPGMWLELPGGRGFARYRLKVTGAVAARVHVTADERYELYVDGELIGRGPERGDGANWFFETFDLDLVAGEHRIEARVWAIGAGAPWAQVSVRPGFLLVAEADAGETLSTGRGAWEVQTIPAIAWASRGSGLGCGPGFVFDCAGLEVGAWEKAKVGELPAGYGGSVFVAPNRHFLRPAMLQSQLSRIWDRATVRHLGEEDVFADPLRPVPADATGEAELQPLAVPAGATWRVVLDLGEYVCFYPTVQIRGGAGAVVRVRYTESLWKDADTRAKDGFAEVAGRVFRGLYDEIRADGREHAITIPWWRCGRFVQLEVKTAGEPLEISAVRFTETRYDISPEAAFASSDATLEGVARVALRTAQMCAHETYMDCPYYEQLQYVGDTRLQMLLGYLLNPDDRLQRKALVMFDASRTNSTGLVLDAYPGQGKLIPPFALWYIGCLHDFSRWRGDRAFIEHLMPGAREVMERFLERLDQEYLLISPPGWNYVDVADGFTYGVPPGGEQGGRSGVLQMQTICGLSYMEDLEEWLGESSLKARWRWWAEKMVGAAEKHYWNTERGLFADDLEQKRYSQHAQVLAIMTGLVSRERGEGLCQKLATDASLARCNIYFSHYLFDVLSAFGHVEEVRNRYAPWADLVDKGMTTFPEHFGYTRSECHAWSSHPLCHYIRHVLGYATIGWGSDEVVFDPVIRDGEHVQLKVAHRKGMLDVELRKGAGTLTGRIAVPAGVRCKAPHGVEVAGRS